MNQDNRKESRKQKALRILFEAMILGAAVSLLGDMAAGILSAVGGLSFSVNRAASIGIIGGADGPTSILIMSFPAPIWQTILEAVILVTGILGLRYMKRR